MQKRKALLTAAIPYVSLPIGGKQWKLGRVSDKSASIDVTWFNAVGGEIAQWKAIEQRATYFPPEGFASFLIQSDKPVTIDYYITDGTGSFDVDVDLTGQTIKVENTPGTPLYITTPPGQTLNTTVDPAQIAAIVAAENASTVQLQAIVAAENASTAQLQAIVAAENASTAQLQNIAQTLAQPNGCLDALHVEICPPAPTEYRTRNKRTNAGNTTTQFRSFDPARQYWVLRNVNPVDVWLAIGGDNLDDDNAARVLRPGDYWYESDPLIARQPIFLRTVPNAANAAGSGFPNGSDCIFTYEERS